jgi:tetratricopeptide (TPR) repeat protein
MGDVQTLTLGPFQKNDSSSLNLKEQSDLRKAGVKVQALIGFKPEIYGNYFIAGKIAYLLEDYPTAVNDFNECVLHPWPVHTDKDFYIQTLSEARYLASRSLFNEGRFQDAADQAAIAVRFEPKSVEYRLAEARAEIQLHHDRTAIGILMDVLKMDPRNAEAKKMLAFIKRNPSKG